MERGERATRDIVSRSSYLEIMKNNGTDLNGVIFNISNIRKDFLKKRFPKTVKRLWSCNIDLMLEDRLNCSPTAHFLMGDMMINTHCETSLAGLYAFGEDAGGIHGGNRLGGNGVADALVFGYRAGRAAGKFAQKRSSVPDTLLVATSVQYYNQSRETCRRIEKKSRMSCGPKWGWCASERSWSRPMRAFIKSQLLWKSIGSPWIYPRIISI